MPLKENGGDNAMEYYELEWEDEDWEDEEEWEDEDF
jgi:hypothetical protein